MNAGSYEDVISDLSCVINGLLNQQRKSGDWNQRHCAVWKNYFLCYKDKIDIKPQAAFTLEGFLVRKCNVTSDSEQNQYAFELTKPGVVTHVFEADSEDNLKQWLLKLQEIITESIPNTENTQQETANQDLLVAVTEVPDKEEMETTSRSFSFPAVDDEQDKLRNINVNSTRIHTCLSFDSVTKVTEFDNPTNINTMQRSDEIEDLSCIINDYESSDEEELIMIEKNKLERQQQFQPENSTVEDDVFEDKIYDFQINKNEFTEVNSENTMQDDEGQIEDKVELRKHEIHDEFLSTIKDRTKSLSEEVFEALGMTEEIEPIKEEECETASRVKSPIKENDVYESKKEVMPPDEETRKQISRENETKENMTINVSVQRLKEFFQEATKRKQQLQCRKENTEMHLRVDPLPFPQIEGFLNVISESTTPEWTKMWAALKIDHIDFRQSPNSDKSHQIIPINGLQLQPSVWDTNRLLAFKIIRNNKVEVIVEVRKKNMR